MLEITVNKEHANLQTQYCSGKYSQEIIECIFYNKPPTCLYSCKYAQTMNKYKIASEEAKARIVKQAERTVAEMKNNKELSWNHQKKY